MKKTKSENTKQQLAEEKKKREKTQTKILNTKHQTQILLIWYIEPEILLNKTIGLIVLVL